MLFLKQSFNLTCCVAIAALASVLLPFAAAAEDVAAAPAVEAEAHEGSEQTPEISETPQASEAPERFAPDEGGAGNLLIAPTRVILSGRQRSAEILLKNRGSKAATYRMSFVDFGVSETGDYVEVESYEKSAKEFIRYSPRQVTLEAGATQKVKLLVRKPSTLASGEYRSHLKFQALPDESFGSDVEAVEVADGVSVKLIPLVGVTIPVVVQHGELAANVSLKAVRKDGKAEVVVARSGARSVFGDITIRQGGKVVAQSAVAMMLPVAEKTISIALPESAHSGALTAEFVESQGDAAKPLATAEF